MESDIVTLHVPLTADTANLIGARTRTDEARRGDHQHCARRADRRGGALEALESDRLGGAGLDVLAGEPPAGDTLLRHRGCSRHRISVGARTEAVYAMGKAAIDGLGERCPRCGLERQERVTARHGDRADCAIGAGASRRRTTARLEAFRSIGTSCRRC
jgi:ribosomal protein S27AE